MAFTSITVTEEARERLLRFHQGTGDSFSKVILRELCEPCETCGELLDSLEASGVPRADPNLKRSLLAGRGRRSRRKARL